MSKKKNKKRKPQGSKSTQGSGQVQPAQNTKRFDPLARNLLWLDLVFLAAAQIMLSNGMITNAIANVATLVGVILLFAALYIQFKPKNKTPKPPRL